MLRLMLGSVCEEAKAAKAALLPLKTHPSSESIFARQLLQTICKLAGRGAFTTRMFMSSSAALAASWSHTI